MWWPDVDNASLHSARRAIEASWAADLQARIAGSTRLAERVHVVRADIEYDTRGIATGVRLLDRYGDPDVDAEVLAAFQQTVGAARGRPFWCDFPTLSMTFRF